MNADHHDQSRFDGVIADDHLMVQCLLCNDAGEGAGGEKVVVPVTPYDARSDFAGFAVPDQNRDAVDGGVEP